MIDSRLFDQRDSIEAWFQQQFQLTPAPINSSIDLRHAGYKLAPVDTNLFPAGFNNIADGHHHELTDIVRSVVLKMQPDVKRIALIPESHTRNIFYLESLAILHDLITAAGFDAKIGLIDPIDVNALQFDLPSGKHLQFELLTNQQGRLNIAGFDPDLVWLNNDLSSVSIELLQNIEQKVVPPLELGWAQRLKSSHFSTYAEVTSEFSELVALDPWLLTPAFRNCGKINFMKREGEDCLLRHCEALFSEIKQKYYEYGITDQPFVMVKADAGTYGMGVMSISHVDEITNLNRKQRTRMSTTKGNQTVSQVILQEGVHTKERYGQQQVIAEPVVYCIGEQLIGGFYRMHADRGSHDNLNAPGMIFKAFDLLAVLNKPTASNEDLPRYYVYSIVARLAVLAAAREANEWLIK